MEHVELEHYEGRLDSLAFTYRQVAEAANISERMVRKLVRQGSLEAVRTGKSVRIPRREVLRLCGVGESRDSA